MGYNEINTRYGKSTYDMGADFTNYVKTGGRYVEFDEVFRDEIVDNYDWI